MSTRVDRGAAPGSGTVLGELLPLEWSVASRPLEGFQACGDRSLVMMTSRRALVAAVDGLGHGQEAARAAELAVRVLIDNGDDNLALLFDLCHRALRDTRGVVMSLALVDADQDTLSWAGVGDVEGVLLRGPGGGDERDAREYLIRRAGVVGGWDKLKLRTAVLPIRPGDTLILATDGIRGGFEGGVVLRDEPVQIAEQILAEHASQLDDSLVFVGRYLGWTDPRRQAESTERATTGGQARRLEPTWGR